MLCNFHQLNTAPLVYFFKLNFLIVLLLLLFFIKLNNTYSILYLLQTLLFIISYSDVNSVIKK